MVSDLTRDGLWVNATTDSLTEEGAKSSRAMPARSVVMAVSGAPGITAILNHDACIHDGFVGLRDLDQNLLPEFVAYTLNLLRAKNDQQAVGAVFRNLTTDQVKAISIPLPPIELQRQFQEFLFQVQAIQTDIASSDKLLTELLDTIRIEAFSGELTESWRQRNLAKISESVLVRDARLIERGAKVSVRTEVLAPPERPTDISRPMRQWLIDELSEFQREVWNMLRHEWRGLVIVDDPEVFDDFCTNPQTTWRVEHFKASNKRIRQTLEQLAALGLIAKVSVPKSNAVTQQIEYLTAFRPLREDENTRLLDAARLKSGLEQSDSASYNSSDSSDRGDKWGSW
jgi:type I restriction enzyme S subunit